MPTSGVGIGQIGIGAFDPVGKIGAHEQIKNAIDAVGGNPAPALRGQAIGDIISGNGPLFGSQCCKHGTSQRCPLLSRAGQRSSRGFDQLFAMMFAMGMRYHLPIISTLCLRGNQPVWNVLR